MPGSSERSSHSDNSATPSEPTSSDPDSSLRPSHGTSNDGLSSDRSTPSAEAPCLAHPAGSDAGSNTVDEELQNRPHGTDDIRQRQPEEQDVLRPRENPSGSDDHPCVNPGSSHEPTPPFKAVPSSLLDSPLSTKTGRLISSLASSSVAGHLPAVSGEGQTVREFLDALNGSGVITNVTTTALQTLFSSMEPETPSSAGSAESVDGGMDLNGPEFEQAPPGVTDRKDDNPPPSGGVG